MTPPSWLYWPDSGSSTVWEISGAFDTSFGSGQRDNNPVFTTPGTSFTGLQYIGSRSDGTPSFGLAFVFDNQTNRDAFVTAYGNDFATVTYTDTLDNTPRTTNPGWVWDTTASTTRAYLRGDQFDSWSGNLTALSGQTYTITAIS